MESLVIAALIVFVVWPLAVWATYETCVSFSIEKSSKGTHEREQSHA
jgi:hypothetical protein